MAAAELRIETFVHISAMGADEDSSSTLLQSKALGEKAVLAALAYAAPTASSEAAGAPAPLSRLKEEPLERR